MLCHWIQELPQWGDPCFLEIAQSLHLWMVCLVCKKWLYLLQATNVHQKSSFPFAEQNCSSRSLRKISRCQELPGVLNGCQETISAAPASGHRCHRRNFGFKAGAAGNVHWIWWFQWGRPPEIPPRNGDSEVYKLGTGYRFFRTPGFDQNVVLQSMSWNFRWVPLSKPPRVL